MADLLRRVVACSLARGVLEGADEAAQRGRGSLVARLLEEVTPLNAHTTWLLLRVLLDEQVHSDVVFINKINGGD